MIDDYESVENLSKTFQEEVINNQKKLREVRRQQFLSFSSDSLKTDFRKIKEKQRISKPEEKSPGFQQREKTQIAMLVAEMNKKLLSKIKIVEDNSFKMKELVQERILLKELERKRSNRITDALKILSAEYDAPLMPLLVHVDMLLQKQELSEKQKNHLRNTKQNILSCLNI